MSNFIGLYYPFIHFKDEAWLKATALYWDRVKRIVPADYQLKDSETVKKLTEDLELIENVPPPPDEEAVVGKPFVLFLMSKVDELRSRYGVEHREKWNDDPVTSRWAPYASDKRLAYVHISKISEELKWSLVDTGLAQIGQGRDEHWVGMHPRLANVYMTVLAEHVTSIRGWYPITDEVLDQLAVSGFSMERLSRALLDDERLASNQAMTQESTMALANVCLETVIPKDLGRVPVEKIIELRKQHKTELTAFQEYLAAFRTEASKLGEKVTGVNERSAFVEHLKLHYQKTMKPSIDEVRNAFTLMKLETITSVVNVNFVLPPLLLTGATQMPGSPYDPILSGIAGFALGLIPIIKKQQAEAEAALKKPGAWLLRLEEGLKPHTFMSWVRDAARKFMLEV